MENSVANDFCVGKRSLREKDVKEAAAILKLQLLQHPKPLV
jgi:hypothetical protein